MTRLVLSFVVKDILKQATDDGLRSATELPYFDGDFWPNALEDSIRELDQEEEERRKTEATQAAQAAAAAAAATNEELEDEVTDFISILGAVSNFNFHSILI